MFDTLMAQDLLSLSLSLSYLSTLREDHSRTSNDAPVHKGAGAFFCAGLLVHGFRGTGLRGSKA